VLGCAALLDPSQRDRLFGWRRKSDDWQAIAGVATTAPLHRWTLQTAFQPVPSGSGCEARQTATPTLTRRNQTMFGMFYNGPLNRKQYWLDLIALMLFSIIISMVVQSIVGHDDELIHFILGLAVLVGHFRLIFLRACDVGYEKPGWMTAGCLLPLAGFFIWLTITTLPTGSRVGCMLPCRPSTQKRWAQERMAQAA
jgi:uncharacterized membrane protein YhaH (DUF805 family)